MCFAREPESESIETYVKEPDSVGQGHSHSINQIEKCLLLSKGSRRRIKKWQELPGGGGEGESDAVAKEVKGAKGGKFEDKMNPNFRKCQ